MIPKIVHYCWFGGNDKPDKVKKCIESWKKCLPDYQLIEWNEDNFDISKLSYTKQAYEMKKYAFVSDVARVNALKKYGGIYMDTDVEVLQSFDNILDAECVLGFEAGNYIATSFMAAVPDFSLFNQFTDLYKNLDFLDKEGRIIPGTNVSKITDMLQARGLKRNNEMQILENGIKVYPKEYFSPYDYINCYYQITEKTYCVHHFLVSWMSQKEQLKKKIKKVLVRVLGPDKMNKARNMLRRH